MKKLIVILTLISVNVFAAETVSEVSKDSLDCSIYNDGGTLVTKLTPKIDKSLTPPLLYTAITPIDNDNIILYAMVQNGGGYAFQAIGIHPFSRPNLVDGRWGCCGGDYKNFDTSIKVENTVFLLRCQDK